MTVCSVVDMFSMITLNQKFILLYNVISLIVGVILLFNNHEESNVYKALISVLCIANSFFWGSFLLLQIDVNQLFFWLGGIFGMVIGIILCFINKKVLSHAMAYYILIKISVILGNYRFNPDSESQIEALYIKSMVAAVFVYLILCGTIALLKRTKKLHKLCPKRRIFDILYASCLVTGCIYSFAYDTINNENKFINSKITYVNFYKAIYRADWLEEGKEEAIFYGVVCCTLIIFGICLYVCSLTRRKIYLTHMSPYKGNQDR